MGWTRHGLALYVCGALNLIYAFYSLARGEPILAIILLVTYLINIYAVAIIEDEEPEKPIADDQEPEAISSKHTP